MREIDGTEVAAAVNGAQAAKPAGIQITREDMALALGQRDVEIVILQKRIRELEDQLAKTKP